MHLNLPNPDWYYSVVSAGGDADKRKGCVAREGFTTGVPCGSNFPGDHVRGRFAIAMERQ
jgi:hypothetical protein